MTWEYDEGCIRCGETYPEHNMNHSAIGRTCRPEALIRRMYERLKELDGETAPLVLEYEHVLKGAPQ